MKMTPRYVLFFFSLWSPLVTSAQEIVKQTLKVNTKKYSYYETPLSLPVRGILILLPAAGESAKSIFTKTTLPGLAAKIGYVTITPQTPTQMFADEECIAELNELTKLKTAQYNLQYQNIVIGGLSDGGAIALGYTEYLNSRPAPVQIKAVFAIDPPADLGRIYRSAEMEISYNCPLIQKEGRNVKNYLDRTLGGPPDANSDNYLQKSVFTAAREDGGNARFLKDAVVRLYCEPDLAFVQRTYCTEVQFFNLNAFDLEKLSKFLKDAGNARASYIATTGRGFHSWNIVDADECVKWIAGN